MPAARLETELLEPFLSLSHWLNVFQDERFCEVGSRSSLSQ